MKRQVIAISSLLLAGCASTGESPLVFGQSNVVGLSIGASATQQGGDLTLGYKGQDFAVVPVTMVQPDGGSEQIGGSVQNNKFLDAYSVLGQFKVDANRKGGTPNVGLGKFFATGLAAKRLADGFAQRMGDQRTSTSPECKSPASTPLVTTAPQQTTQQLTAQTQAQQQASAAAGDKKPPVNTSLIFAQFETLGFSMGAAGAQQGADLTLGYKDWNVAVVPSLLREPNGHGVMVRSKATRNDGTGADEDALSVLGQFELKTDNETTNPSVGLGKFFATGVAAKRLSDGFATRLCEEFQAPVKKP